ncbi:hypothetical protein [Pseudomonas sp.]|jgi:hypothetical protein|uniref:hypothetical protein n=1 Tax=Pseudomonas sp. TaxID=306 RepID=UPI002EDA04AA
MTAINFFAYTLDVEAVTDLLRATGVALHIAREDSLPARECLWATDLHPPRQICDNPRPAFRQKDSAP